MTPKRKAALQWMFEQGEVSPFELLENWSRAMFNRMVFDGQIAATKYGRGERAKYFWSLTDKGRRDLHEATQ